MQNDSGNLSSSAGNDRWGSKLIVILLFFLAFFLTLLVICTYQIWDNSALDKKTLSIVAKLDGLSGRLEPLSGEVVSGSESTLLTLTTTTNEMHDLWRDLQADSRLSEEFVVYGVAWEEIRVNIDEMTSDNIKNSIANLNSTLGRLRQRTVPAIQIENAEAVDLLIASDASRKHIAIAQRQSFIVERILRSLERLVYDTEANASVFEQYRSDIALFNQYAKALLEGDAQDNLAPVKNTAIASHFANINSQFGIVNDTLAQVAMANDNLLSARQARERLLPQIQTLSNALGQMRPKIEKLSSVQSFTYYAIGSVIGILACMAGIIISIQRQARISIAATAEATQRNQTAILRLLNELDDLADGDLTTTATVTEDFTGAIADSINFTIEQLRLLVERINTTAEKVTSAAQSTQQTALHLADASDHQSQEIAGASAAISEMAVTIDQVSANASESALVAEKSVSIAKKGAKVVQDTIQGMDTIREQIQDTSKRIKRLGESSQEIGNIVSLINDIADQTNILALNAAIQASMAGEAGRGFAVVADEVQRLAERSAAATKEIEKHVKIIQTDTNEAVSSMEQTTTEVVHGAKLAQDAGVALGEIENVSSSLAELIQSISDAARQQASSASQVSNIMNVIQEITSQTSAGTEASALSIGALTEMALDLRESVAGFKLPDESAEEDDETPLLDEVADYPLLADPAIDAETDNRDGSEDLMELLRDNDDKFDDLDLDLADVDFEKNDDEKKNRDR